MIEFINNYGNLFLKGFFETIYMVGFSVIGSYLLGLPIGIALYVTEKDNICENLLFNKIFGWIVNILRSIPFIILIISVMPITRLVVGKAIGATAAIVPLVIGSAPFVGRMIQSSLKEIDFGIIEACECMGASNFQIITKVLIKEALPSILRGVSITTITLIGYSAMAGAVGAGGLGDIAIRYGYNRKIQSVMIVSVLLVIIIVCIIQRICDKIAHKAVK